MPPRAQYHLHRYAARPSTLAPADKSSRSALRKRAEAIKATASRALPMVVTKGFLTDVCKLARRWMDQANELERSPGAQLITSAAARKAKVETLKRVAKALRDLIDGEGV
jgi:hypothetical protein